MKIEFTREEVEQIILQAAHRFDPKMNTVKIEGTYGIYGATVSYVEPATENSERTSSPRLKEEYAAILEKIETNMSKYI